MRCASCGFENPEGMSFCGKCGTSLTPSCPRCGFANPADFAFCGKCGSPLAQPAEKSQPVQSKAKAAPKSTTRKKRRKPEQQTAEEPRPGAEAERRQLTVMFCDLVDSTALSAQLDPEEYRELVRAYQRASAAVIDRFEGYIAQYLGDGLLVYFGYPAAHEDDGARAVRVGLRIIEALHALNPRLPHPLQVRIGIHTGPVVVGEMGGGRRQEQLALGETPNLAARLQGQAAPDEVLISAATYHLIEGLFACEERGQPELKGVATPLTLYLVVKEEEAQNRFQVVARKGLTPLVGREHEYGLLRERWQRVTDGEGQVVLFSGEPGIGKSRLVEALKETVEHEGARCLELRCSPYAQSSALHPVTEHLQRVLRFRPQDAPEEKLRKLAGAPQVSSLPTEALSLLAALLSLPHPEGYPPLTLSPQRQKEKTHEALVAWLCAEAKQQAMIYAWEDLHWADPSTLELLTLFLAQVPTTRLLAVLTYRPEFTPSWGSHSYLSQLTLSRLGQPQVEVMVEKVTGGKALPQEVVRQIASKTDGVPLFVEELTKMVVESGLVIEVDGHYELSGPLPPLAIPATLQDSLMARLDRLATVREIAQLGATLGREFSYDLLHAVSPLNEETLQQGLGQLVEAELLYQRGLPPQATYLFKHALIQDASYQSLLKSTRQRYHHQIVQVLEDRFPAMTRAQPELLAHHCIEGEAWRQAFHYLTKAGEKLGHAYANREAIVCYTRAIEVSPRITPALDEAQLLSLYESRGLIWVLLTKYDEAIEDFRTMLDLSHTSSDQQKEGESLGHLAYVHWLKFSEDHIPFVERYAQEALRLSQQTGDQKTRAGSLASLGLVQEVRGNLQEAEGKLEESLQISRRGGYKEVVGISLLNLGALAYWQGVFPRAMQLGQEGVAVCREIHDGFNELYCLAFLCLASWSAGHYPQALALLRDGMTKARERDNKFILGRLLNTLGWFHSEFADVPRALEYDQESVELGRVYRIPNVEISALINVGLDYLVLDQPERARSYLEPTFERVQHEAFGAHRWRWKVRVLSGLAELSYTTGVYEQALRYVEETLKEAQATGSQKYIAKGWALRGKIMARLGSSEAAGAEFQRAFTLAEQLHSPALSYPLAYELGQWHEAGGKEREAVVLYGKAKAIIEHMTTTIEDEALRSVLLQSTLVQAIYDRVAHVGALLR